MDRDNIRKLANGFARLYLRYEDIDVSNKRIVLRNRGDVWDLDCVVAPVPKSNDNKLILDFPALPTDKTEGAIELAGFLSQRLTNYFKARSSNEHRSSETRKASAQKAINARWSKQKTSPEGT